MKPSEVQSRITIGGVHPLLVVYLAGVIVGLWRADASPAGRAVIALGWPVGAAAAAVVGVVLCAAALVLFPTLAALVAAGGLVAWMLG